MRGLCQGVFARALGVAVSAVMLGTSVQVAPVLAETPQVAEPSGASQPVKARELVEQRTATSRAMLLPNGHTVVEYFSEPIHYKDTKSGNWLPIDSRLETVTIDGRPVAANRANSFALELPTVLGDQSVGMKADHRAIEMRPARANRGVPAVPSQAGAHRRSLSATEVVYEDAFDVADLEYESQPEGLKETIVLSRPTSVTAFGFELNLGGLTPRKEADGSISLLSSDGAAEMALAKPCMWDAAEEVDFDNYTDAVSYEITSTGGGNYLLTVTPDAQWLNDPLRVYPVRIDPTIVMPAFTAPGTADTYISSGAPSTNYFSSQILYVNNHDPGADYTEYTLLQPGGQLTNDLVARQNLGHYVVGATLKVMTGPTSTDDADITCSRVTDQVTLSSITWNNRPNTTSTFATTVLVTEPDSPYYFDVTGIVDFWQKNAFGNSAACVRLGSSTSGRRLYFKSEENAGTKPSWTVEYAPKPVATLVEPSGDEVFEVPQASWTTTESIGNAQSAYEIQVATSTASTPVATNTGSGATTSCALPVPPGGFLPDTEYSVRVRVATAPTPQTTLWSDWSGWGDFTLVLPTAVTSLSAETSSSAEWFYESDANADGLNDAPNDSNGSGRGAVALSWSAAPGATNYKIYLHDGNAFRQVGTTTATSWTTAGKGLYPTDSKIASMSAESTTSPFLAGTGLDLRDDPRPLYARTAGSSRDASATYLFKVVAANSAGECSASNPETSAALDVRTVPVNVEPAHPEYDMGEMLRHDATARLDTGAFNLDITDLAVSSWGPTAALSRHYSSDVTQSALFAPGWRFTFEQTLEVSGSVAAWSDAQGTRHVFYFRNDAWTSPLGGRYALSSTGAGWKITFVGGDELRFDTAGALVSEADRNGNTVTYVRAPGSLAIIAANGQYIDVALDGAGRPAEAQYETISGIRAVTYEVSALGSEATATLGAGTTDALPLHYAYAGEQLAVIDVPAVDGVASSSRPGWSFEYASGQLRTSRASTWPMYLSQFEFGSNEATVTVWRDMDWDDMSQYVLTRYELNPTGTIQRRSEPSGWRFDDMDAGVDPHFDYWTYAYDSANREIREISPLGAIGKTEYDTRGNVVRTVDPLGAIKAYSYDAYDRPTAQTDQLGSTTFTTYDGFGNPTVEERVLNTAGERSRIERTYNASGTLTCERTQLDEDDWAQREFSDFSLSGEPQNTTDRNVALSSTETVDVVSRKNYDGFGQLLSEQDGSGVWVTKANTYSPLGYVTSTELADGSVERIRVNTLGFSYETSTTSVSGAVNGRQRFDYDVRGAKTAECRFDAQGNPTSGAVLDLDNMASVKSETPVSAPARVATSRYDAAGRVTKAWAPGISWSFAQNATRTTYDAVGHEVAVIAPGHVESAATTITYDLAGRAIKTENPDGTWIEREFDAGDNVIEERKPVPDGDSSKSFAYDLAGRQVSVTNEDGHTTQSSYDLAGRQVAGAVSGKSPSSVVYNSLGWEISRTDNDGIVTLRTYDKAGRPRIVDVAGKKTCTTYDSCGRTARTDSPDGRRTEVGYDAFSRAVTETQSVGGVAVKVTHTSFDEQGRPDQVEESKGEVSLSLAYSDYSDQPTSGQVKYPGATVDVNYSTSTGWETRRVASIPGLGTVSRQVARDPQGRAVSEAFGAGTRATGYDDGGHVASMTGFGFSGSGAQFGYDTAGRKSAESISLAYPSSSIESSYTYTDAGTLSGATIAGITTGYEFDSLGNLVRVQGASDATLTYDAGSRLVAMGATTYGWDVANGRRTSMRRSGETSVTFGFTDEGRLETYRDPNRSVEATYSYDAGGQRTRSVVTSGSIMTTTTYTYDGLTLLSLAAERSDNTTWSISYLTDEAGRPWGATYVENDGTPTLVYVVTTDRGDVVELLDTNGSPLAKYGFDAWGNPRTDLTGSLNTTLAASIAEANPLRYSGYAYDEHSGLYYCSQRYYDPATYQWITKDPARADGEESAYQYCAGAPVSRTDPSGLYFSEWVASDSYHTGEWGAWYVDVPFGGASLAAAIVRKVKGTGYTVSAFTSYIRWRKNWRRWDLVRISGGRRTTASSEWRVSALEYMMKFDIWRIQHYGKNVGGGVTWTGAPQIWHSSSRVELPPSRAFGGW